MSEANDRFDDLGEWVDSDDFRERLHPEDREEFDTLDRESQLEKAALRLPFIRRDGDEADTDTAATDMAAGDSLPEIPDESEFPSERAHQLFAELVFRMWESRATDRVLDLPDPESDAAVSEGDTTTPSDGTDMAASEAASTTAEMGQTDLRRKWNPALHPRDPLTGRFVKRPWSVPSGIRDLPTVDIVRELAQLDPDFLGKLGGLTIDLPPEERRSLQHIVAQETGINTNEYGDIGLRLDPGEIPVSAVLDDDIEDGILDGATVRLEKWWFDADGQDIEPGEYTVDSAYVHSNGSVYMGVVADDGYTTEIKIESDTPATLVRTADSEPPVSEIADELENIEAEFKGLSGLFHDPDDLPDSPETPGDVDADGDIPEGLDPVPDNPNHAVGATVSVTDGEDLLNDLFLAGEYEIQAYSREDGFEILAETPDNDLMLMFLDPDSEDIRGIVPGTLSEVPEPEVVPDAPETPDASALDIPYLDISTITKNDEGNAVFVPEGGQDEYGDPFTPGIYAFDGISASGKVYVEDDSGWFILETEQVGGWSPLPPDDVPGDAADVIFANPDIVPSTSLDTETTVIPYSEFSGDIVGETISVKGGKDSWGDEFLGGEYEVVKFSAGELKFVADEPDGTTGTMYLFPNSELVNGVVVEGGPDDTPSVAPLPDNLNDAVGMLLSVDAGMDDAGDEFYAGEWPIIAHDEFDGDFSILADSPAGDGELMYLQTDSPLINGVVGDGTSDTPDSPDVPETPGTGPTLSPLPDDPSLLVGNEVQLSDDASVGAGVYTVDHLTPSNWLHLVDSDGNHATTIKHDTGKVLGVVGDPLDDTGSGDGLTPLPDSPQKVVGHTIRVTEGIDETGDEFYAGEYTVDKVNNSGYMVFHAVTPYDENEEMWLDVDSEYIEGIVDADTPPSVYMPTGPDAQSVDTWQKKTVRVTADTEPVYGEGLPPGDYYVDYVIGGQNGNSAWLKIEKDDGDFVTLQADTTAGIVGTPPAPDAPSTSSSTIPNTGVAYTVEGYAEVYDEIEQYPDWHLDSGWGYVPATEARDVEDVIGDDFYAGDYQPDGSPWNIPTYTSQQNFDSYIKDQPGGFDFLDLQGRWKQSSYNSKSQTYERAFMQALGLPGEERNHGLNGYQPSEELIDLAAEVNEMSKAWWRDNSDSPTIELHRGIANFTMPEFWAGYFHDPEADEFEVRGNAVDNWTTDPDIAENFASSERSLLITEDRHINDLVAAHDVLFKSSYEEENELVMQMGTRTIKRHNLRLHGGYGATMDSIWKGKSQAVSPVSLEQIESGLDDNPDLWTAEALNNLEFWADEHLLEYKSDSIKNRIESVRKQKGFITADTPDEAGEPGPNVFDYSGWENTFSISTAAGDQSLSLSDVGAKKGVSAGAMEVIEKADGTKAYVKWYSQSEAPIGINAEDRDLFERSYANYQVSRALGGNVPPHHFEWDGADRPKMVAVQGVEGREASQLFDYDGDPPDRTEYVNQAAIQLIAGNNDAHSDNVMLGDDGNVYFHDIDHSGGLLSAPEPSGTGNTNIARGLAHLASTADQMELVPMAEDKSVIKTEIYERAVELAGEVHNDGFYTPEFSDAIADVADVNPDFAENIMSNVEELVAGTVPGPT